MRQDELAAVAKDRLKSGAARIMIVTVIAVLLDQQSRWPWAYGWLLGYVILQIGGLLAGRSLASGARPARAFYLTLAFSSYLLVCAPCAHLWRHDGEVGAAASTMLLCGLLIHLVIYTMRQKLLFWLSATPLIAMLIAVPTITSSQAGLAKGLSGSLCASMVVGYMALLWRSYQKNLTRMELDRQTALDKQAEADKANAAKSEFLAATMKAEEAASQSEAHFRLLTERANDVIVQIDLEGAYVYLSPSVLGLTGYSVDELLHVPSFAHIHPDDLAEVRQAYTDLALDRRAAGSPVEYRFRRKDGVWIWLEVNPQLVRDEAGLPTGFVDVARDVTERKAMEADLRAARTEAEAAAQAKAQFLANMSHEIRTPLNGLLTMAEVMDRGPLSHDQKGRLGVVRQSGRDLLHLLNDILDFSKIEAGKLDLEDIAFDTEHVLEATLAGFAAAAEAKGLQLWLDVAPNARGLRHGDPGRLRQIVSNFVSNALKFTERGGVRIELIGLGEEGQDGVQLAVRDSGLGIAKDKLPFLFQVFSQLDASTTRRFGGTGLGLSICQELASLMGGRVWADSVEGVGSSFYVTLVLPRLMEADIQARPIEAEHLGEAPAQGLRVLAAEDNPTNQIVLSTIMQMFGFELTLVGDGAQVLQAWRERDFDVILMDVQMPVMDGVQATRAIRSAEAQDGRPRTPIIALSANAYPDQVAGYLAAGMDSHVAKPIELSVLQAALEAVLDEHAPAKLAQAV